MKKIICFLICAAIIFAAVLPTAASETAEEVVTEETTEAVTEAVTEADIDGSMSLSEMILALAQKFGISVEDAEELVGDVKDVGDKYLEGNGLWDKISEDIQKNPAKWTIYGIVALLILFLIGVLIKRVINDALNGQRQRIAIENIDKSINGDEDVPGNSLRELINKKNDDIDLLGNEHAGLEKRVDELKMTADLLTAKVEYLSKIAEKMEKNSDTSLKMTEESALQILQLLNIALDRKVPITSKEARQIWYEHTQNNIKSIYEGAQNGGETEKA